MGHMRLSVYLTSIAGFNTVKLSLYVEDKLDAMAKSNNSNTRLWMTPLPLSPSQLNSATELARLIVRLLETGDRT